MHILSKYLHSSDPAIRFHGLCHLSVIKHVVISTMVPRHPDPNEYFQLCTDLKKLHHRTVKMYITIITTSIISKTLTYLHPIAGLTQDINSITVTLARNCR